MMFPNHIAGGIAFTGLFGGLMGHNIFQTKTNIACVLICSIIPDIDLPKSPIGRIFKPLSIYINHTFGHRTITHSVFALAFICILAAIFKLDILICGLAFFSHIFFDMMTMQGVPIFSPLSKIVFFMPKNPQFRIKTGDTATETLVFASFIFMSVFTYPLMQQGFWTTYNNSFGTQKTLHSEFTKSTDLLEVNYTYEIASQTFNKKGFVIECSETRTLIMPDTTRQEFEILEEKDGLKIKQINFTHTKRKFYVHTSNFILINTDSLNRILDTHIVLEIDLQATKPLRIYENSIENLVSNFKKIAPSLLRFRSNDTAYTPDKLFLVPSTTIAFKQNEIETIKAEFQISNSKFQKNKEEIEHLKTDTSTDYIQREANLKRLAELKTEKPPELDTLRIRNLEFEIQILKQNEALQNQIKQYEFEKRERIEKAQFTQTQISGTIKYLKFQ